MPDLEAVTTANPAGKPRRGRRKAEDKSPVTVTAAVSPPSPDSRPPLMLAAELGIDQAAGLREQLAGRLEDAEAVVLDASDVQRIHTAAMQLFCLFCSDRRRSGRDVSWQRPSPALRSAAALLGVTTLLQIARETA